METLAYRANHEEREKFFAGFRRKPCSFIDLGRHVTTDLFVVSSGLDRARVRSVIPPSCRRDVGPMTRVDSDRDEAVLETPAWTPRRPAHHFVPAWGVLGDLAVSFRFELSIEVAGRWSPWIASASIGRAAFTVVADGTDELRCDVDLFTASRAATAVRARVRLRHPDVNRVLSLPWLFTLSACDLEPGVGGSGSGEPDRGSVATLSVPALSQMESSETLARRICSPTCVAMLLQHRGYAVDVEALAAEMFQSALDLYGVWSAAVAAAARRGVAGYLLRFPDWAAARWCLEAGLPIVASVRYANGELTGAAIAETSGHLIVLTGYDGEDVLVNDPAASTRATVARRYDRAELERIWLGRAGVGYVFFEPARSAQR